MSEPAPEGRPAGPQSVRYLASALVLFLALFGSQLATPLYPTWKAAFSLSTSAITIIYASYSLGVTAGLLWGGSLGDQLGRRPLTLAGLLLTAAASFLYLSAAGIGGLVAARLLNGFGVGLLSGPLAAAIVELHPHQDRNAASRLSATATLAAPAAGLLAATLVVEFAASMAVRTTLPFLIQLAGLGAALLFLACFPETLPPERRRLGATSWAPQRLAVGKDIRRPFVFCGLAAVLVWSSTGLWLSLGPSMVLDLIGSTSQLFAGLTVVAFLTTAGLMQILARGLDQRQVLTLGLVLVPASLVLIVATLAWKTGAGLVAGALLAGAGQGLGWLGCLELANRIAPAEMRASVLSTLFVCGYLGTAVPILGMGVVADLVGLFPALLAFTALFCTLAAYLLIRGVRE